MAIPTTIIATTFYLSTSHTITVTDDSRTSPTAESINPGPGGRYFRIFACAQDDEDASGATSPYTAAEFLDHVERRLNVITPGLWTVELTTQGKCKITYLGDGTPNGAITWTSTIIRNILGFTSNISGLTTGQSATGTYQVCWALFTNSRSNCSNWRRVAPPGAYAEFGDGTTYGFQSSERRVVQSFDCIGHPRTASLQSSTDTWITPIKPDSSSRQRGVTTGPEDTTTVPSPPWSLWDWIDTSAPAEVLGACLGNLQTAIQGTTVTYDQVSLTAKCRTNINTSPVQANHGGKDTIQGIELSLIEESMSL